jgi:hypothetical protein
LERWSRSEPHMQWWKNFLRDSGGTGFWHETYFRRSEIEAIYDDIGIPMGLSAFAPAAIARGPMFSARTRLGVQGSETVSTPLSEAELYGESQ